MENAGSSSTPKGISAPIVASALPPPRTSKRKRSQVSYLADDYFDELDIEQPPAEDESEVEEAEDDSGYFGHKRSAKKPAKKKSKRSPTTKKERKEEKEKPFRFLDLPAELRDEIYELVLTEPEGLTIVAKTKNYRRSIVRGPISVQEGDRYYGKRRRQRRSWWGYYHRQQGHESQQSVEWNKERSLVPNLLAVNKQIREEGSSFLYKQELNIEDTTALLSFIATIGPYNRALLTDITLRGWGEGRGTHKGNNFAALTILAGWNNLRSLRFECTLGWFRNPDELARQIYRDGHHFLEGYGYANGSFDAAIDVVQFSDWHFSKKRAERYSRMEDADLSEVEFEQKKRDQFEKALRALLQKRHQLKK